MLILVDQIKHKSKRFYQVIFSLLRFIQSLSTRGKGTKIYNRLIIRSVMIELSLSLTTVAPSKMLNNKKVSQIMVSNSKVYLSAPKRAARSLKLIWRFIFSCKQNNDIFYIFGDIFQKIILIVVVDI